MPRLQVGDTFRFINHNRYGGEQFGARGEIGTVVEPIVHRNERRFYFQFENDQRNREIGFVPNAYQDDVELLVENEDLVDMVNYFIYYRTPENEPGEWHTIVRSTAAGAQSFIERVINNGGSIVAKSKITKKVPRNALNT